MTGRVATLAALLVVAGPSTPVDAQESCDLTQGDISAASPSVQSGGNFCQGGVDAPDCFGTVPKASHTLTLSAVRGVDLICSTDAGRLCIMNRGCSDLLGTRIDDQTMRLTGTAPAKQLRIVIADNDSNDALCGVRKPIITCEGLFGDPDVLLAADFEDERLTGQWTRQHCPGTSSFSGALTAPASAYFPTPWYKADRAGRHRAELAAGSRAELELRLWWWDGSDWRLVASRANEGGSAKVDFDGLQGYYRWEIRALEGHAAYRLELERPCEEAPR